mmetsp:Transcript_18230/g.50022  ORF Transcript_18230/g.50022 Transcript_18230/m.50022 type:complete len:288 (-) Transcript_18230:165-1028(-)
MRHLGSFATSQRRRTPSSSTRSTWSSRPRSRARPLRWRRHRLPSPRLRSTSPATRTRPMATRPHHSRHDRAHRLYVLALLPYATRAMSMQLLLTIILQLQCLSRILPPRPRPPWCPRRHRRSWIVAIASSSLTHTHLLTSRSSTRAPSLCTTCGRASTRTRTSSTRPALPITRLTTAARRLYSWLPQWSSCLSIALLSTFVVLAFCDYSFAGITSSPSFPRHMFKIGGTPTSSWLLSSLPLMSCRLFGDLRVSNGIFPDWCCWTNWRFAFPRGLVPGSSSSPSPRLC